jgi:hypothetical protein
LLLENFLGNVTVVRDVVDALPTIPSILGIEVAARFAHQLVHATGAGHAFARDWVE